MARVAADRQGVVAVVRAAGGGDAWRPAWDARIRGTLLSHLGIKTAIDGALRVRHWGRKWETGGKSRLEKELGLPGCMCPSS